MPQPMHEGQESRDRGLNSKTQKRKCSGSDASVLPLAILTCKGALCCLSPLSNGVKIQPLALEGEAQSVKEPGR